MRVLLAVALLALTTTTLSSSNSFNGLLQQDRVFKEQFRKLISIPEGGAAATEGQGRLRRCAGTSGTWCGRYDRQVPVDAKPPPRGDKDCPKDCNNQGMCQHDLGICYCSAGWTGPDCATPEKRPCTNSNRGLHEQNHTPHSHIDASGRDLDLHERGWTASRCSGICDDDIAVCFCDGKYKRIPPPLGSPPGTPPVQYGRILGDACALKTDKDGNQLDNGGHIQYENLYGPNGWCEAENPQFGCGCALDGFHGSFCSERSEMFCPAQCSGHGTCYLGYCHCDKGWYGVDCTRKKAGLELDAGVDLNSNPWLKPYVNPPPAALDPPPQPQRRRPFIFVYDVPAEIHSRLLQYRAMGTVCTWRKWNQGNSTSYNTGWLYSIDSHLHEMMLSSEHRTFDPEEADFFYMPLMYTCYFWPIMGWADHPWFDAPHGHRVIHATNMMRRALDFIKTHYGKYWERRGGRDHIWLMAHDEGACYAPTEIYNSSIMLTHWGRMDLNHTSGTAYPPDNYSSSFVHPFWQPIEFMDLIKGHPCYDPKKDLVIPSFKAPEHYLHSPILGAPQKPRDILLYFKGDVGLHRLAWYSRGIRQGLYKLSQDNNWRSKYNIIIAAPHEGHEMPYGEALARSVFCLVAPGDGWSSRAEDCVLHGSIPVVVMDNVHAVLESVLNWDAFSVRVSEQYLEHIPVILKSIPQEKVERMQQEVQKVWHRFAWASHPKVRSDIGHIMVQNRANHNAGAQDSAGGAPSTAAEHEDHHTRFRFRDDAFGTLIQWLYSKMESRDGEADAE